MLSLYISKLLPVVSSVKVGKLETPVGGFSVAEYLMIPHAGDPLADVYEKGRNAA
jgi:hypothetical protein